MGMYEHILFATDLTELSHKMAVTVADLVRLHNAKISIVHVIEPIPAYGYPGMTDLDTPVSEHAIQALQELAGRMNIPAANVHIEYGSVKGRILAAANDLNVDLIIVGSHGRHGLGRLMGSCASAIVHGALCDVLVLRTRDH
jgi:universal stress protein A